MGRNQCALLIKYGKPPKKKVKKFHNKCEISPKMEKFCLVEFSNFLLGQKFVTVKFEFSIRSEIRRGQNQIRIL